VKKIDKYILLEMAWPFLFGLSAFTSLLLVNILFLAVDYLNQGIAFGVVSKWVSYNIPSILVMTLPMSCLLGSLLTFGRLSGNSEISAMWAGGLSLKRIITPVLIVSLLLSVGTVLFNDMVVSKANLKADLLLKGNPADSLANKTKENFYYPIYQDGRPKYIWIASTFNGAESTMENVSLFEFVDNGFARVVTAKNAVWIGNVWYFRDGYVYQFGSVDSYQLQFKEHKVYNNPPPKEMAIEGSSRPEMMNLRELGSYIDVMRKRGSDIRLLLVEYHLKMAIPMACVVFAVIGVPFGLQPHRGGSSVGLGLSIILIFLFYILLIICKSLGQNGILAPILAAWGPNLLFAVVGITLIKKKTK
jgi:lipopolysaccharide export system permease protein